MRLPPGEVDDAELTAVDTDADDLLMVPIPPLRSRDYKPGHRVQKPKPAPVSASAPSPWVGKPREGFTSTMGARAQEMSATRQATMVRSTPRVE